MDRPPTHHSLLTPRWAAWTLEAGRDIKFIATHRSPAEITMRTLFALIVLCAGAQAAEPFQLADQQRLSLYRRMLPQVKDEEVAKLLADKRLLLYTDHEMPKAHQDWEGALQGIHSPLYNISADRSEPHGNGNVEFPWGTPFGTHRCDNVGSLRFLQLPQQQEGRAWPVAWYRQGPGGRGYAWVFPVGSILGEVVYLRAPNGSHYTFELRTRSREVGKWRMNVFRPFPTMQSLEAALVARGHEPSASFVSYARSNVSSERQYLASTHPGKTAFSQVARVEELPPLEESVVYDLLLNTPFVSALGSDWKPGLDQESPAAPTTKARFHIVPKNYLGGFVSVDSKSCMRCHETTNRHVDEFDQRRDWYGRIRGSDGIFSFHPFAAESISANGFGQAVRMNQRMTDAGIVAQYDGNFSKFPRARYHQITGLH